MRHRENSGRLLATALLFLCSGCIWERDEFIDDVMWSDDDEMFAIIVGRVDVRSDTLDESGSDQKRRNWRSQIYVMPSDFSEDPVSVTAERKTAAVSCFLMSGAGYLLANWGTDNGSEMLQYMLDGETTTLATEQDEPKMEHPHAPCSLHGLPSPAGEFIAVIRDCGFPSEGSAFVHILDAYSHEVILERTSIPPGNREIWTSDSRFVVFTGNEGDPVLYWSSDSNALVPGPIPACNWPPTTSGPVAEDGTIISPGVSLDEPIEFSDDRPVNSGQPLVPFGCQ